MVGRATGQFGVRSDPGHRIKKMLRSKSWVGGLTTNSEQRSLPSMARRKGRKNYKQIKTGTVNLGTAGAHVHIAAVRMLDDVVKGTFLNNIQFSVMTNSGVGGAVDQAPSFTMYLSTRDSSAGWSDDQVIAVSSTGQGGGNGNLVARRVIRTNEVGSQVARDIGPVHVWLENTDVSNATDMEARVTLTAWGRMHLLDEDF